MAFTLEELGAKPAKAEDGRARATAADVKGKRDKLIEAINKHIQVYIDNQPITEPVVDADGKPTGKTRRVRVLAMSSISKKNSKDRIITLKYGNKAVIEIVAGQKSIAVPADAERGVFEKVIAAVEKGDFDKQLEAAAKEAGDSIKKKS